MTDEEKQLKYFLNYVYDQNDVFIRSEAILWFKQKFFAYWENIDKKENGNYIKTIQEFYLKDDEKSLEETAKAIGLHVRSLKRYRTKFVAKMKELIQEYKNKSL